MPGYQPLGKFPPFRQSGGKISFSQIRGGIINAEEVILAGGTRGRIRSENYDPTNETGWGIFGDGSASFYGDVFFGENAIFQGDLFASVWDGNIPADLSTPDSGASAGYYLDSSGGSAQFMGDLFLGGNALLLGGGTFRSEFEYAPGQTQAVEITTGGIFFESGQPDETNPGLLLAESGGFFGPDTAVIWLNTPVINTIHQGGYLVLQNDPDDARKRAILGTGPATGGLISVGLEDAAVVFDSNTVALFTDDDGHNLQGLPYNNYTPTLTNLNVGSTGAVNTARYVRIGDVVHVEIFITLGGTGISVGDVRIQLPFDPAFGTNSPAAGECLFVESGVGIYKGALNFAGNTLQLRRLNVSGSNVTIANLSSTAPFTWKAGDSIRISAVYKAA